ncbi:MAG: hypothetical protein U0U66_02830 [Cytophagaceae bacterium]
MTPLLKKLNFKSHKEILLISAPIEFKAETEAMKEFTSIKKNIDTVKSIDFILSFVKSETEVEQLSSKIDNKLNEDGIVWFAFPKKTSKKYQVEINRDFGWSSLGELGYEPVRSVAIDEDWSALRFRKVAFIKTMKRNSSLAMSKEGKSRIKKK